MSKVEQAAYNWLLARKTFLALPPGHESTRAILNDLAEAEHALAKAVLEADDK